MRNRQRKNVPSIALNNLKPKKRRIFIRTALMSWFLVVFTVIILLAITIPSQRAQLLEEMRQRAGVAYTTTLQVAIESIVLEDLSLVVEHSLNLIAENPSLKYVVLTRKDGFSLIHTPSIWRQERLTGLWLPPAESKQSKGRFVSHEFSDGEAYHLSYPLIYSGIDWGWIHLGLSPQKYDNDFRQLYIRSLAVSLLAIIGGLLASFWYARSLSVPIQRLEQFAQSVAAGDLSHQIELHTRDELQTLAETFNDMVQKLKRSNQELVKTARQAGMAEMTVNVLHNVGNVLNSIGVTAQAIKARIRQSKMTSLEPVVEMLEGQANRLDNFIASDPRGSKLPAYLSALSSHLSQDHRKLSSDIEELEHHVQHIQDIIHLQQDYSRTIGLTEQVDLAEIVEDALQLNIDAIKRHRIAVVKELAHMPPVLADRQKLLQILTNLICNAKQAFENSDTSQRQISIFLDRPDPQTVRIRVCDNGMGISEENLTRIFQHGFTTRKNGHGFGLHSSALAAAEMKGTLTAASEGGSKGAVFTLEVPYRTVSGA